jgi:hypothetical protein
VSGRPVAVRPVASRLVAASVGAASLVVLAAAPRAAGAQAPGAVRIGPAAPEGRVDVLAGRATTWHAGGGVTWGVGRYVRLGAVAGAGLTAGLPAGAPRDPAPSARLEVVARFVVDPSSGRGWRWYGGAGGGALVARGQRGLGRVHLVLGAEAPAAGRLRPGVELGVGGGVRLGLTLRHEARPPWAAR